MLSLGIYIIGSLVVIVIIHYWRNPKSNGKLPPGSMGWPLLGKTIQFFAPNTSFDISPFVKERMQRYGPIFRTSLVGYPIIVSTDPYFNYFIFQQEGQLFQSWYPHTFEEIFGRQNVGSLHGFIYKYLKNMGLNLFGPESLKNMLPEVEKTTNNNLNRWSRQKSVEMKEATTKMIFDLTGKKLISYDSENSTENVCENFTAFIKGLISFPLCFPGTAYHKCLQEFLRKKEDNEDAQENARGKEITTKKRTNFETTSLAITLAIKFLHEHPKALKKLTEEHEAIIRRRENASYGLTWKEYKSMKFTFQFINETVRLANIAPLIFRKALKDINFKGYTIPAGWAIMVYSQAVHLNPAKYEDSLQFNPWRWEGIKLNGATRNFMAFGGGIRYCIGADFAKVQMAVFLHCFVTKYK
ncbi:hypothetical protein MTR67_033959 [Solanum verrucosum]|uniref:Cytochrome P450 n=1 Tax=Solanum verrucosum TaxID=315347 RepID=A0AAF0U7L5_SOLVR|nr:hypothetical protein MTR67_033959 [Solanum verrucosum]